MSLFSDILSRLNQQIQQGNGEKELIASIISEVLGTAVSTDAIVYKDSVLRIALPSTAKMTLQFKRVQLLQALNEKGIKVVSIS